MENNGMLVLSRKEDESINCYGADGTKLEIRCLEIQGNRVRLGFTAPKETNIVRKEIDKR